jgi:hypothetical protein
MDVCKHKEWKERKKTNERNNNKDVNKNGKNQLQRKNSIEYI